MVEIIEVDKWPSISDFFVIDMKSLEDLEKIAVRYGIPYIYKRRMEYILLCGSESSLHFYRFNDKSDRLHDRP